jgi:hypothetical protein
MYRPAAATNKGLFAWATTTIGITLQIVRTLADQTGFVPVPHRCAVEPNLAWITHARRNTRDYESLPNTPKPSSTGP